MLRLQNTRQSKVTNRRARPLRWTAVAMMWRRQSNWSSRPMKLFIYRRRCVARRHMINWRSSVYEASWPRKVHIREVSGKCKYWGIKSSHYVDHKSISSTFIPQVWVILKDFSGDRPHPEFVLVLLVTFMFEPQHDKTNKMTVRPAKTQISLDIRPVWSESSLCAQWVAKDPSFLHADSEDSDQTGRMWLCTSHL